ncbi:hypothetical protein FGO68_gene8085 [Halteria grandinella]|uniref:EF-hand domain-containing protein n=1 Tax=Halteria grandinella TaxID=5974 RepID=A0A8J8P716_HALGN|nr:hypothetical protein FGO68_gene8085 [Halteria grandinella]
MAYQKQIKMTSIPRADSKTRLGKLLQSVSLQTDTAEAQLQNTDLQNTKKIFQGSLLRLVHPGGSNEAVTLKSLRKKIDVTVTLHEPKNEGVANVSNVFVTPDDPTHTPVEQKDALRIRKMGGGRAMEEVIQQVENKVAYGGGTARFKEAEEKESFTRSKSLRFFDVNAQNEDKDGIGEVPMNKTIFNKTLGFPTLSRGSNLERGKSSLTKSGLLLTDRRDFQAPQDIRDATVNLNFINHPDISRSKTSLQLSKSPNTHFKKYLPNIIKTKHESSMAQDLQAPIAELKKLKVMSRIKLQQQQGVYEDQVSTIPQPGDMQMRQDVSYLKELNTPTQKPTILTTGDRGQDKLLEATMGIKNLGRSLINLPSNISALQDLLKAYQGGKNILSLFQQPEQDEEVLDRYLLANFSPLDALQLLQDQGNLTKEQLSSVKLANLKLKPFLKPNNQLSPKRHLPNKQSSRNRSPSKQFNNTIDQQQPGPVNPHDLEKKQDPVVETDIELLSFINSKLMRKYGDKAFIQHNSLLNEKHLKKPTTKDHSVVYSETDLFGEPLLKTSNDVILPPQSSSLDLGNPSSRQDAVILLIWFEKIFKSLVQKRLSGTIAESQVYPLIQLVMNIAMQEITRQVSVHCVERGLLLKRIFNSYIGFLDLVNMDHNLKRKTLKNDFALKLDRYITIFEHQATCYKEQIADLEAKNTQLAQQMEEMQSKLKDQSALAGRFRRKCGTQHRDLEANNAKVRYLEKENAKLKGKLNELKEDFQLDGVQELDENDRLRLILEVEREMQDLERDKQLQTRFNLTKNSSHFEGATTENEQYSEKELIGVDERETSTHDLVSYLVVSGQYKYRDRGQQTEMGENMRAREIQVDAYKVGCMESVMTDTSDLVVKNTEQASTRKRRLTVINEGEEFDKQPSSAEEEEDSEDDDYDDNDEEDLSQKFDIKDLVQLSNLQRSQTPVGNKQLKGRLSMSLPSSNHSNNNSVANQTQSAIKDALDASKQFSPAQATTELIEFLAVTLVQRANDLLQKEVERIDKIAEVSPPLIGQKLRASLKQTTQDVAKIKEEIERKRGKVRKSLRENKRTESTLKQTNERLDSLEMDNYDLREQIQEQIKLLEEYRAMIAELQGLIDQNGGAEYNRARIVQIVGQLSDMIQSNQQKTLQLTTQDDNFPMPKEDYDDNASFVNPPFTNNNTSNTPDKSSKSVSNHEFVRKRGALKFAHYNIGQRASPEKVKGTHPAYAILKKIQSKDPKKLREIMPRKMLLRVIYQVYQEKGEFDQGQSDHIVTVNTQQMLLQTVQSVNSVLPPGSEIAKTGGANTQGFASAAAGQNNQQASLLEWVYDSFMQKYGLKNVAERKFVQLISSCITYKNLLPRIQLFGRFFEVYDDLPTSDYNRYLKLMQMFTTQILNFRFDENTEITLLPLTRAIDYFKFKFDSKMVPHIFQHKLHAIEKKKKVVTMEDVKLQKHLKGVREAIDFDWFAQHILDTYIFLQEDREMHIRDLFLALDVSNTGNITLQQFEMAMKVFHYKSAKYTRRLFEEYTLTNIEGNTAGGATVQQTMTMEQFGTLALERELFTPKVQFNIIKCKHPDKDFDKLKQQLPSVISLMRARLVTIEMNNDPFYHEHLLENLQNAVTYPYSPRVAYLCYRVTNEAIKRLFLKKMSDQCMPVDISKIQKKVKPSAALLNTLPITHFDTNQ